MSSFIQVKVRKNERHLGICSEHEREITEGTSMKRPQKKSQNLTALS